MTYIVSSLFGFWCGIAYPRHLGPLITLVATVTAVAVWYAEHGPDAAFDALDDFAELAIQRLLLPWVIGGLVGVIWVLL